MATVDDLLGPPPSGSSNDPETVAKEVGLPPGLFSALIKSESAGRADAVSDKGAVGKGQTLPSTAKQPGYGIQPFKPGDLKGSAQYLKKMIDLSGGDVPMGLRRYKQGPNGELNTKSADDYTNKIVHDWKPSTDQLLGPPPTQAEVRSPIASSPNGIGAPPKAPPTAPPPQAPQSLAGQGAASLNRAANVTVQTLQQAGQEMNQAMGEVMDSPLSPKAWGKAGLAALGVAGSPITSLTQGFLADPLTQGANKMGMPEQYNQAVEAGTQLVAGLAAPAALAKFPGMAKSLSPIGKWALGVADTYDSKLRAGVSATRLGYEIAGMEGRAQAKMTQWLNDVQKLVPQNYQAMREEIAHSFENPGIILSPEAQAFKAKYLEPIMKETDDMYQQLAKITGQKYKPVANYYPRTLKGEEKALSGFLDPQETAALRGRKAFGVSPPELQDRSTGTVFNWGTGEFGAYTTDKDTGKTLVWVNKNVVDNGTIAKDVLHGGAGSQWQVLPGTMKEIEQHTDLKYVKDPIADAAKANKDVFLALSNAKAIERLKHSPEFAMQAKAPGGGHPDGWVDAAQLGLGTHQLDGWKLSPRLQEVLQDAMKVPEVFGSNKLGKLNRIMIGSLFFNPTAHIMNVAWHSWVEKGLVSPGSVGGAAVGAVAGAALSTSDPGQGALQGAAMGAFGGSLVHSPTEMKALMKGIRAVTTRNEDYMRFMADGAGLMFPGRYTRDFYNNMLRMTGTEKADPMVIKAFGYGNAKDLVSAIYNGAGNTMWFANDVIMMQGYLAKEEAMFKHGMVGGAAMTKAINEVEKHVPNYRIPGRVGPEALDMIPGGADARRMMSQILQGKTVPAFGRYDYGRIASYTNMMKDLVSRDKTMGDRTQALNQIAALGFGTMVVMPQLFDEVVKGITGNQNASYQKYGPFTVPWAVYDYMNGGKTWPGLIATMLPMAPAFRIGAEVFTNRDVFTDKSLHLPQGAFDLIMRQYAPTDQINAINQGRMTPKQWLESQFGIKDPTNAQVAKAAKFFHNQQEAEKRWQKKQEKK